MKKILIIGGYGSVGSIISDLLIQFTDCEILIGGRNLDKSTTFSLELNQKCKNNRSSPIFLDLEQNQDISFSEIDVVIIAAPVIKYYKKIVDAVEKYNCKCIDLTPPADRKEKCLPETTKNLYIIDAGGIFPLAMIKYINILNPLIANVYNSFYVDWSNIRCSHETITEFNINRIQNAKKNSIYIDNSWYTAEKKFDRYEEINGERILFNPIWYEEVELITKLFPSIVETGIFYNHNNHSIKNDQERSILKAVVENKDEKKIMYVKYKSGYYLSAAGTVATLLQCLEDNNSSGVYTAGEYLDPFIFFNELKEKMNIDLSITDN